MKQLLVIGLVFFSSVIWAQDLTLSEVRDEPVLSLSRFLDLVESNHPLALSARLQQKRAEAGRLGASGAFDPQGYAAVNQKYFDGNTYYRLGEYGLEIPAWYGLKAKTGYETNDGIYLNPQENLPQNGLWFAGLSLTLGKGLFLDERRANLKKARLLITATDYEIDLALNQLYLSATEQYWQWYRSYFTYQLYQEAVNLARERLKAVVSNATLGEAPMIDTLEARIQLQNRILNLQDAGIALNHARQMLATFLWLDGEIPLELSENTRPRQEELVNMPLNRESWLPQHPALKALEVQLEQLQIDQQLNREALKPEVDLNYNFLNEPVAGDFTTNYSPNNYSWGLSARFPLFLRKERSAIEYTRVDMRQTELQRQLRQLEIENQVAALQNEVLQIREQLAESRRLVNNRQRLLESEIIRFDSGESSLFLINQREIGYLDSRAKLIELEARGQQVLAKLQATAAILND